MRTALHLVTADLRVRRTLLAGAVMLVAAPLAGYLLLQAFSRGVDIDFASSTGGDLIVQESNSVGEITGSRIDAATEQELLDVGVAFAIPEIHAVAGSSAENAVLLRGVDLDRYPSTATFELTSGRPLEPGDGPRQVMLGADLAAKLGAAPGETVSLRGRGFEVVGIFQIGTYADNEAWLSLQGARSLLGWEDGVSVFVIPGDGPLSEGDVLPGPLSVARRGDFVALADEWDPIFALADFANFALAAAAAVILAVILWRLAWLRRRELAVLRAVGIGRAIPVGYLALEGMIVTAAGFGAGILGAIAMGAIVQIDAFGLRASPVFDATGIVRGVVLTATILVVAVAAAGFRTGRMKPADLLRGD